MAVLPDVPRLVRSGLLANPSVTNLISDRISTRLPDEPVHPHVTVRRTGGTPPVPGWLDAAQLRVDCWADDELTASTVARTVRAALHDLAGYTHQDLGVITGVEDERAPTWEPDPSREPSPTPRYVFEVVVYAHP